MTDNPAPRPEGRPRVRRFSISGSRSKISYVFRRSLNATENPACHTLPMLDRCIAIYCALDRLVERVSGDAFILERLREIASAELAEHDQ